MPWQSNPGLQQHNLFQLLPLQHRLAGSIVIFPQDYFYQVIGMASGSLLKHLKVARWKPMGIKGGESQLFFPA